MFLINFSSTLLAALLLFAQSTDATSESFEELGSLFLWGIVGAVCVAAVVVFIWLKIQSKREGTNYVSIAPSRHGD